MVIPIVAVCLAVAFVVFRGWRGMFPDERHHWQRRHASPPAVESEEPPHTRSP